MSTRRVVTGLDSAGRSTFLSDAAAPMTHRFDHLPGSALTRLWHTENNNDLRPPMDEPTTLRGPLLPAPGETGFLLLTFGPDSAAAAPDFDPARAAAEFTEYLPDLGAAMEPDSPGMHTTASLDYVIVIEGEVWLELDNGETRLTQGDVVVQIAARHAWRNKSNDPVTLALVMVGGRRSETT